jgi:hypothetical protein
VRGNHAQQKISLFGSTYICEQFSSNVNIGKNPCRNKLNIESLERGLHVATSQVSPNINI